MDKSIVEEYLYQVKLDKVNCCFMLIINWKTPQTECYAEAGFSRRREW